MTRLVTDWQGSQTMTKDQAIKKLLNLAEHYFLDEDINACKLALEQPAQEPVAWIVNGSNLEWSIEPNWTDTEPLYTHPYQWQGLTDDEIKSFAEVWGVGTFAIKDIEATLKKKNYGS